ncbi:TonB-dependent receptor [Pedobacter frigiditerrae]|uniref:TonB-dependent receptor n=1 Tax=Pedobacter frigiditerrae TaxID=2530452 RepID=A0A4R0N0W9_9SPHI|nr:carboxypeptidase-like regulatory domain-containing protein [Pedobacter frigiditerrae]TCC93398.1 TonB-dependent receptor [Pedobacter frigiditerrae]
MKKKIVICLICTLSLFSFSAFIIDDDPITALLKKLEEFTKKFPQEKVYLHLDKPYYAIGDDIWFKAYVIDSKTSEPTSISNILYIDLINEKDSLTKQLKLQMISGIAWGDFKLSDSLAEGNYRIRAYTQWMRNAGSDFFFDKNIKIGNSWANKVFTKTNNSYSVDNNIEKLKSTIQFTNKTGRPYNNAVVAFETRLNNTVGSKGNTITNANGEITIETINKELSVKKTGLIKTTVSMPDGSKVINTIPIKSVSTAVDVQFFPEGGRLIEGLPCKVAFKAINNNGIGENVSGVIIDNEGLEVLTFESTYLGMGSFSLNPSAGKIYIAKIKLANGMERIIKLPVAEDGGYTFSVNNLDTAKASVKVMLTENLLNKGELSLIAQHNGEVLTTTKISTTKQISTVVLPKAKFPSGIIQLTLFSPENLPVSERIIFVNNSSDKINLSLNNFKSVYTKKGNVNFDIVSSNNNQPVQGSFSIAITNSEVIATDLDNESNILTSLLLTSDLKGFVEKPNHYFLNKENTTAIELDNLLLTQGWRKIDWNEINSPPLPATGFPAEKNMSISGLVTTNGNKPVVNGKITLLSTSKGMVMASTATNEMGRFIFDEVSFGDSIKFMLQASNKEGKKDVKIALDKFHEQPINRNVKIGDIEVNVNTSMMKYLMESGDYFDEQYKKGFLNRTNQLKTVNIVKKIDKKDSASVNSSNYNGRGNADKIITAKDLENSFSLAQYIAQGRIMGVADSSGYPFSTRLPIGSSKVPGELPDVKLLAVSLDGMLLGNFSLDDIPIGEIESVEVLQSAGYIAAYGSVGQNGLLIITTKRGKGRKMSEINAPGITIFTPKGYDTTRQFYSPKYDTNPDKNPDLRTTILWNPNVVTDATGKANINYYNTDRAGNYRIVIEGIDVEGNLARKVITYQVN